MDNGYFHLCTKHNRVLRVLEDKDCEVCQLRTELEEVTAARDWANELLNEKVDEIEDLQLQANITMDAMTKAYNEDNKQLRTELEEERKVSSNLSSERKEAQSALNKNIIELDRLRQALEEARDLARTDLRPLDMYQDEAEWDKHRLAVIARIADYHLKGGE